MYRCVLGGRGIYRGRTASNNTIQKQADEEFHSKLTELSKAFLLAERSIPVLPIRPGAGADEVAVRVYPCLFVYTWV